jgi:DsbC/DsbD-like thiol-disulfide interchange protein
MKEHWHTYWINPGETGNPTRITLHGPAGVEFGKVGWPLPAKIDAIGGVCYGYENDVLFLIPVKVPKDFAAKAVGIDANVEWVGCQKEECVEGSAKLAITLPISLKASPAHAELFQTWKRRLPDNSTSAAESLAGVNEVKGADGLPVGLAVQWKQQAPAKVDFFPMSTEAAVIQNVAVKSAAAQTQITFKTTIYAPEKVPQGKLDGLLVFEDAAGRRQSALVSVQVVKSK